MPAGPVLFDGKPDQRRAGHRQMQGEFPAIRGRRQRRPLAIPCRIIQDFRATKRDSGFRGDIPVRRAEQQYFTVRIGQAR